MDTTQPPDTPAWLLVAIIGGFFIVFPVFWCGVVWLLSRIGGWHLLAANHASGSRLVTGTCSSGITGRVGSMNYRNVLTLHADHDGFFLDVMPLFRVGHPRLFISWSEITASKPYRILFWKAECLSIGDPVITTITLPADWVANHRPA
ncbi:hypothetical protein [Prosthecobacter sp.]|uniref:hypothetical protein n=1 Tax=Prosthecobacter sp. TaxID=1965333 RepID=UPI001D4A43D5|nr:hypothetical protein [Prosthecobacter sp.]MCB1278896.1 hypothetical protein [Prosthecobacter sp.]